MLLISSSWHCQSPPVAGAIRLRHAAVAVTEEPLFQMLQEQAGWHKRQAVLWYVMLLLLTAWYWLAVPAGRVCSAITVANMHCVCILKFHLFSKCLHAAPAYEPLRPALLRENAPCADICSACCSLSSAGEAC
jgi:hypothetical protein